ncbi:MAG: DUF1849 family protein [Parvibaculum sedimenti]|uniref:EipB family protein n=1 Tax=Parvibaculum sedimenti TaxID=2608632 RepID=UPI003BB787A7
MWDGFGIRQRGVAGARGLFIGAAVVALALVAMLVWAAKTRNAGPAIAMQMHRAVYDLSIDAAKSTGDTDAVSGRMVVEWRGGPRCEGYTSEQRVVTNLGDGSGGTTTSDIRLSSWESLDGNEFRFDRTEYTDGKVTAHVSGHAVREDGHVLIEEQGKAAEKLPEDVLFPTAFNIALLKAAADGKGVFSGPLFDGTQDGPTAITAFIGAAGDAPIDARKVRVKNRGAGDALAAVHAWPVHMSYFDKDNDEQDGTPSFEMGFRMFPNGVMSSLEMNYDDVVLKGELSQIEYFKPGTC